jgi:adenylyltransferase/sulfurtransferase
MGNEKKTDIDVKTEFTPEETSRYGRQFVLPDIGFEGQQKLKSASVLIVGAGGLGSPSAMYLSAAGVGRIGIVDFDQVEHSNLQRQVIYGTSDVGKSKVEMARRRILDINPNVSVVVHPERLTSANALSVLSSYHVVIDGSDNLATRYLINDACVLLKKPDVYGAVFQFEGQASVFYAERGPCYRCLFPEPPPPELVTSCAEGGVLGMLPGIIGSVQAIEAVKLLVGFGESLIGRLILFDGARMDFREVRVEKAKACPVCGERPTIQSLIDYESFCGVSKSEKRTEDLSVDISVQHLKQRLDNGEAIFLLDVREPYEHKIAHLNARLIPLRDLPNRLPELNRDNEIVVYCHTGVRSASAAEFLRSNGFRNVKNLTGGIDAWAREIDPTMVRY